MVSNRPVLKPYYPSPPKLKYPSLRDTQVIILVLRIRIEKMRMRMRIQEKISMRMRMRMRIHALTELWRAK